MDGSVVDVAGPAAPVAGLLAPPREGAPMTGRIGPNAVTRIAEALADRHGVDVRDQVFAAAGLTRHLLRPPQAMVPEADVAILHLALRAVLGAGEAAEIGREAGRLTGLYLLARRIPKPAQVVLKALPAGLSARLLLLAIRRHAWTFAGSGRFGYAFGRHLELTLEGSPLCRLIDTEEPACTYFAATFETIFRALVSREARVTEIECEAMGAPACRFVAGW